MSAISEAMLLGTRLGVDPKVLAAALNSATARCWSSDTYNPYPGVIETAPSSRGYEGGFAVDLMLKDLKLATDAAAAVDLQTPMGNQAQHLYQGLQGEGYGKLDFSSVLKYLDQNSVDKTA
mmetsp:Transcript_62901/g.101364  ORF Transcript_62901/g.101364 Transcript_62901/m.101364 type:complete len:121 (+) Transcript_62901:3-365(+)